MPRRINVPATSKVLGLVCNLRGMKRYIRMVLRVKAVFSLQLVILRRTAGIHAVRLDFDIENTRRSIRRGTDERAIPFLESSFELD